MIVLYVVEIRGCSPEGQVAVNVAVGADEGGSKVQVVVLTVIFGA
jgi:hypothetical protein